MDAAVRAALVVSKRSVRTLQAKWVPVNVASQEAWTLDADWDDVSYDDVMHPPPPDAAAS